MRVYYLVRDRRGHYLIKEGGGRGIVDLTGYYVECQIERKTLMDAIRYFKELGYVI